MVERRMADFRRVDIPAMDLRRRDIPSMDLRIEDIRTAAISAALPTPSANLPGFIFSRPPGLRRSLAEVGCCL